ncbi:sel1 repeat family protein [Babesia caballi]|uniref:Sel1 repeat family protein n=1 Tax=Babesia caballi TaxID=5871 RepID=A0AAV4LTU3_BABCB|nr:sel1 repeat family protein [Babesia caballi]
MNIAWVIALAAAAIGNTEAAATVGWLPAATTHESLEPSLEEVERRRYESWINDRLDVREHGRFDMLQQDNGRVLRWGTTLVPRRLEIMLHLLNSPVLHGSLLNSMDEPPDILPHFLLMGVPLRLPEGGAAHTLAVAALRNDVRALRQYRSYKREHSTWPTYFDNEAAYTYMWRVLAHQVRVRRLRGPKDASGLAKQLAYCYRNEKNELLRFKYRVTFDRERYTSFAGLISQWSVGRLPLHGGYVKMLNQELKTADRSRYPEEMFDNIGHYSKYVNYYGDTEGALMPEIMERPLLQPAMTLEESLDVEARRVAEVTLKLSNVLMARLLEKHTIPAFSAIRDRRRPWRVHGVTGALRFLRQAVNDYVTENAPTKVSEVRPTPHEIEEIEEILFESSKHFNPYWSVKNDTLYNKSPDVVIPDATRTVGLLFDPDRFLRRLQNIRGERIDFQQVHDVLHRLIGATSSAEPLAVIEPLDTCRVVHSFVDKVDEQYRSLPVGARERLVAKCRCLLAFLYLFGVADRNGRLELPGGWPRSISRGLTYIADGIGSSCGMCNAMLGFLSGIGYPPVVDNMYAWETRKTHVESAVYQMLVTSDRSPRKRHTEYFDKTLLSYLSGHYKDDDASSLAVSYYLYSGIANPSRLLDDAHVRSGVERSPREVGSRCIDALPFVIDAAKSAMRSRVSVHSDDGSEEYRSRRYVEFVRKLAGMGDLDGLRVMGDFHYTGHEAGNIGVDVPRALEYWTRAAQSGDVASALTMANHLIQLLNHEDHDAALPAEGDPAEEVVVSPEQLELDGADRADMERAAERYLRMVAGSNNALAASTARFYMARYGIGQPRDQLAAARHLQDSADSGDVTSQMLMGHAYAGMLSDITPPDGKNVFMALEYYRRAAKSGNIVATFNTAVLTLHGYDLKFNSSVDRCKASFSLFQQVARQSLFPAAVKVLARRAARHGDEIGNTMLNMFLSEMGDPQAHIVAARHFKGSHKLCYAVGDGSPLVPESAVDAVKAGGASADAALPAAVPASGGTAPNGGRVSPMRVGVPADLPEVTADQIQPSENAPAEIVKRVGGIFAPFMQGADPEGTSPCHLFYARRSGHEASGGSPLLLAEALLEHSPAKSVEWVLQAKLRNEPKATYLYATMLEAGAGVAQDCEASYGFYRSMVDSRDQASQLLGFLCIQRARVSRLLHRWPELYGWSLSAVSTWTSKLRRATPVSEEESTGSSRAVAAPDTRSYTRSKTPPEPLHLLGPGGGIRAYAAAQEGDHAGDDVVGLSGTLEENGQPDDGAKLLDPHELLLEGGLYGLPVGLVLGPDLALGAVGTGGVEGNADVLRAEGLVDAREGVHEAHDGADLGAPVGGERREREETAVGEPGAVNEQHAVPQSVGGGMFRLHTD